MGQDTKIHIPLQGGEVMLTIERIRKALKNSLKVNTEVELIHERNDANQFDNYSIHWVNFRYKREQRSLHVYYDYYNCTRLIQLQLGYWGQSEAIAKCLVDAFGGYYDLNDCDGIEIDYAKPQPKVNELIN